MPGQSGFFTVQPWKTLCAKSAFRFRYVHKTVVGRYPVSGWRPAERKPDSLESSYSVDTCGCFNPGLAQFEIGGRPERNDEGVASDGQSQVAGASGILTPSQEHCAIVTLGEVAQFHRPAWKRASETYPYAARRS